ncbi:MAG: DUF4345 domain-containing protein [Aggregatilineales bacterium]
MTTQRQLQVMLWITVAVVMLTGLPILVGGINMITGVDGVNATADSEMRFVMVFWIAYGGFIAWVARDLPQRYQFVPAIGLLMLAGAGARILSMLMAGRPDEMYVIGTILEISIAGLILFSYWQYQRQIVRSTT